MKSKYYIFLFFVLMMSFLNETQGSSMMDRAITLQRLKEEYFASIEANGNRLVLEFKPFGNRYRIYKGNDHEKHNVQNSKVSIYGEKVSFPVGQRFELVERDFSLIFEPLPVPFAQFGFEIEETGQLLTPTERKAYSNKAYILFNITPGKKGDVLVIPHDLDGLKKVLKAKGVKF